MLTCTPFLIELRRRAGILTDLTTPAFSVTPVNAIRPAQRMLKADLLALFGVVVVLDAVVLALVDRGDGVGVPAALHAGGWDWAVHC